ncbi:MAG: T9SS type A sorting domain-containing protein [Janthinobacterium lividum]
MQVDFRSVYTSILKDWLQVAQATLNQLFGQSFTYVPVIKQTTLATTPGAAPVPGFSLYPNPARTQATALFESQGEAVQVSVFDGLGREASWPGDGRALGHGARHSRCAAWRLPLRGARGQPQQLIGAGSGQVKDAEN